MHSPGQARSPLIIINASSISMISPAVYGIGTRGRAVETIVPNSWLMFSVIWWE